MAQIKIQDLLPLMKPGFVAMDKSGRWFYYEVIPKLYSSTWNANSSARYLGDMFDIAPFEGDWKDSLMECGK
nr:MAG TPA: hypothetical protein [Caudoviricetes sp.]